MKSTGIIRRVDELGRLVIPKEIRRMLRIRDGEPLEITVDKDESVILRKFSPVSTLASLARAFVDVIGEMTGKTVFVADRDGIIAVAGETSKAFKTDIAMLIDRILPERSPVFIPESTSSPAMAVCPVAADGECIGIVVLLEPESRTVMHSEWHLLKLAATVLGKYSAC